MVITSLTWCCVLIATVAAAQSKKPYYDLKKAQTLFEAFIKDYDKEYEDENDKQVHFEAFKANLNIINVSNAVEDAVYEINYMADFTAEQKKLILQAQGEDKPPKPYYDLKNAPALFEKFIQNYNKHYRDADDKQKHFEAYKTNLDIINKSNALSLDEIYDINFMTDFTQKDKDVILKLHKLTKKMKPKNKLLRFGVMELWKPYYY